MKQLKLVRPSIEYKQQYESMMEEWEAFGGRLNPGALRRYSNKRQTNVSYEEWLNWIEEDRNYGQDLYFLVDDNHILGAISIRYKRTLENAGIDGHIGFGIRPGESNKGYATVMLKMAFPIIKEYKIDTVVISCAKDNIGSSKVIINNKGKLIEEVIDPDNGELMKIYHIEINN